MKIVKAEQEQKAATLQSAAAYDRAGMEAESAAAAYARARMEVESAAAAYDTAYQEERTAAAVRARVHTDREKAVRAVLPQAEAGRYTEPHDVLAALVRAVGECTDPATLYVLLEPYVNGLHTAEALADTVEDQARAAASAATAKHRAAVESVARHSKVLTSATKRLQDRAVQAVSADSVQPSVDRRNVTGAANRHIEAADSRYVRRGSPSVKRRRAPRRAAPRPDMPGLALRPDPMAARDAAGLMEILRAYRKWAGEPSFRDMRARCGGHPGASTMCRALKRRDELPDLWLVDAIVTGCGGSDEDRDAFAAACRIIGDGGCPAESERPSGEPDAGRAALRSLPRPADPPPHGARETGLTG